MNKYILAFHFFLLCILSHPFTYASELPKTGWIIESEASTAPKIADAVKDMRYTAEDCLSMKITTADPLQIVITTLLGQTIIQKRIEPTMASEQIIIPMSRYQVGTYYISIQGAEGSHRYTLQTSSASSGS